MKNTQLSTVVATAPSMTTKKNPFKGVAATSPEPRSLAGRDGRVVHIPAGFVGAQGKDGRMIAIPVGGGSLEGSDGRLVAIPPGCIGIESAKGRVVPKKRW
jgi:hypothetical protein